MDIFNQIPISILIEYPLYKSVTGLIIFWTIVLTVSHIDKVEKALYSYKILKRNKNSKEVKKNRSKMFKTSVFKISPREALWFSILCGWTFIHLVIVKFIASGDYPTKKFYPFDKYSTLVKDYDYGEFWIYVGSCWVIFLMYFFLKRVATSSSNPQPTGK